MTQAAALHGHAAGAPRARLLQLCAAGSLACCSDAMRRSPLLPLFARSWVRMRRPPLGSS